MTAVSVYAIFADAEEAERIGRTVVEERLAACINILGPCRSIYRWQGKVEQAKEWMLMMKCSESQCEELKRALPHLHGYDVPELIMLPIADGHDRIKKWQYLEHDAGAYPQPPDGSVFLFPDSARSGRVSFYGPGP